ncbi:MAG: hypothetical protein K2O89_04360 [Clostridia bacterium]|nr:hypothetical protein [Clostridia bacterium]
MKNKLIEDVDCSKCPYQILNNFDICNAAYDFYQSAHFLNDNKELYYPKISANNVVAITVNISFSCELFLKGIQKILGFKVPRGHDLFDLFTSLDDRLKTMIINIVACDYEYETGSRINEEQFLKSLELVKNWFVEQRYWFEHDYGFDYKGIGFIKKICDAVMLLANATIDEQLWFKISVSSMEKQRAMMKHIDQTVISKMIEQNNK